MYESSGRILEDLIHIEGSDHVHHESGLFDECLSVLSDWEIQGQYCTVFFGLKSMEEEETNEHEENLYNFQKPSVGFCLPSTCSAIDLKSAVAQHVGHRTINEKNFSVVAIANENYCYTQQKIDASRTFDNVTIAVL